MVSINSRLERGFTIVEVAIVVLAFAVVAAVATPQIVNAMRTYRLNIAARELTDTMNRAKMLAVSQNIKTGVAVDLEGRRIGVVVYNEDGTVNRIDYRVLPQGVSFERPSNVTDNPDGVKASCAVSFGQAGGVFGSAYTLDFNSRGMPMVKNWGDVEAIFVGNGTGYRALTLTSVGGLRSYRLEDNRWVSSSDSTKATRG